MPLTSIFSISVPVEVVASGGILVRQVDTNGVALDDSTYIYSEAMPAMPVDSNGVNEDSSATFSVHLQVTIDPTGVPVVRVGPDGAATSTAFGGGVVTNYVLREDGSRVLREDGSFLLRE